MPNGRCARALEPPRLRLLTQFNALPEGVKFLVDLRAELMGMARGEPLLQALEDDLKNLLRAWFDVGFLEMHRITWDSPASLLEKLIKYEAVHEISGWQDFEGPARFGSSLLRLLPSAHAARAADLRRGGAGPGHVGQRPGAARSVRPGLRPEERGQRHLLFDLQRPGRAGRHQLRQFPDQGAWSMGWLPSFPTSSAMPPCRRSRGSAGGSMPRLDRDGDAGADPTRRPSASPNG